LFPNGNRLCGMTMDSILNTFLEVFSTNHNLKYLNTFFYHILKWDKTWTNLRAWFADSEQGTVSEPSINSKTILIPCHVQGAHWVALTRRIINNQVIFLYADDLNQKTVETTVQNNIRAYADPSFCPPDARWITCSSITYCPHSNECGPRTLLALATMGLHPAPNANILMPLMSPDIAQITKTWIAESLLSGTVKFPALPYATHVQYSDCSIPGYLYQWDERNPTDANRPARKTPKSGYHSRREPTIQAPTFVQQNSINRGDGQALPQHCIPTECTRIPAINQSPHSGHEKTNRNGSRKPQRIVKPPDQPSLFDMNFTKSSQERPSQGQEVWGHEAISIDKDSVFQVILQNPRGLKLGGDQLNTQYSLAICQSMEAGAICLPETNINWGHKSSHDILKRILRKTWKHSSYSVSYTKEEFKGLTQPGGQPISSPTTGLLESWKKAQTHMALDDGHMRY
jgi:hypothetical protein